MKNVLFGIIGAAVGAGVTYILMKNNSEKTIHEEVEKVKEYYKEKEEAIDEEAKKLARAAVQKPELEELKDVTSKYTTTAPAEAPKKKPAARKKKAVVVYISDEQFENNMEFAKETLNYYEEDQVLATEGDEELPLEETVGSDLLEHVGEYEDDVCYVRNTKTSTDYEVIVVHSSYAHIVGMVDGED